MQQIDLFKNYLNNHYNFRFNEISSKVEFKPISRSDFKYMTDRDLNSLLLEMNHQRLKIKFLDLKTIIESDYVPIFNPIKDYFKSLPQMTGNENIKKLLMTIDTHDNDFFEWAFTKWLVAWVACMVEDNAINQQCVILAGNQGIGKSTWVEKLIPNELMPYYFAGNIRLGNKDTLGFLSEKCLINLDELANMTYSNVAELKELVTKSKISFRKAYAQYTDNFIRRASFIGSVNGTEFLYDLTGNRRFLSFEVSRFENYGNHKVDMNLVLAEVYSLFKSGFQYWFDANNQKRVEKNNENFRVISPEEIKILELFSCTPLEENVIESIKEKHLNSLRTSCYVPSEDFNNRKKKMEEEIMSLKYPKSKLTFELYQLTTKKTPTQGELVKFGKILTKNGFKRKRANNGTLYEVYYLKPDLSNLD
ncbi:hypothetical protein E0W68_12435 [Flavobacterium salilacus subsp. salilacus]|uniref:VapE domain-containing protein n=1 Tax=Flavobacterium TaxID=237 RepID=UPI001075074A|nr:MULTISPECIES: VapE domain-containing protein [Flavobacterium]KAF2516332.1 hypothetical protein E0W68_12435 [Flavobacterium salilacus subsp. salilacus]MBE1613864.1 hypothetical protein [Flavobacterium sp. SaA2.13]